MSRQQDRIKFINDRLDEVVMYRPQSIHLEELEPYTWALILYNQEGDRLHLTITGQVEVTDMEEAL